MTTPQTVEKYMFGFGAGIVGFLLSAVLQSVIPGFVGVFLAVAFMNEFDVRKSALDIALIALAGISVVMARFTSGIFIGGAILASFLMLYARLDQGGQKQAIKIVKSTATVAAFALIAASIIAPNALAFAQTPTPELTLEIDPTPLFSNINVYVAMFFGVFAIGGAILIGKRIAEFVVKTIADAF